VFFNKTKAKTVLLIICFYCVTFFFLNKFFLQLQSVNTSLYNFIYTLLEYGTFASLLLINIQDKKIKIFGFAISVLFTVFLFVFTFVIRYKKFDSIPIAAETLVLLVLAFYFFYEQFKDPSALYIYTHYCFWLAIGILIYLCGSLFIYVYGDQMTSKEINQFWFFTYIVEIIKNILFSIAVIIYSRKPGAKSKKIDIPYLDIKELQ
jgi:hypothetical protein